MEKKESGSVSAVEGRIPMTSLVNTVGYLEEYAERVLPVNIYQEFLHSKRKPFYKVPERDFFVQAPGVLSREALRFCSLLNLPPSIEDDNSIINIVPTGQRMVLPPLIFPSQQPQPQRRLLATIQHGHGRPKEWAFDDGSPSLPTTGLSFKLPKGGRLTLYPRMVQGEEALQLTNDIVQKPDLFHQYKVQGFNKERRVQAQFHDDATPEFDRRQPGYRYNGSTTLKARPLTSIPSLKQLADRCQTMCNVPKWNIGATIVFYRNGRDKLGQHRGKHRATQSAGPIVFAR